MSLLHLQLDHVVLDEYLVGVDRHVGRQRQRAARAQVEQRAVARALDRALLLVEVALRERSVVVRAAVLDREDLALAVEHADLEVLPFDDALGTGRELFERADVDDW
jgi:hypothetical protein